MVRRMHTTHARTVPRRRRRQHLIEVLLDEDDPQPPESPVGRQRRVPGGCSLLLRWWPPRAGWSSAPSNGQPPTQPPGAPVRPTARPALWLWRTRAPASGRDTRRRRHRCAIRRHHQRPRTRARPPRNRVRRSRAVTHREGYPEPARQRSRRSAPRHLGLPHCAEHLASQRSRRVSVSRCCAAGWRYRSQRCSGTCARDHVRMRVTSFSGIGAIPMVSARLPSRGSTSRATDPRDRVNQGERRATRPTVQVHQCRCASRGRSCRQGRPGLARPLS